MFRALSLLKCSGFLVSCRHPGFTEWLIEVTTQIPTDSTEPFYSDFTLSFSAQQFTPDMLE